MVAHTPSRAQLLTADYHQLYLQHIHVPLCRLCPSMHCTDHQCKALISECRSQHCRLALYMLHSTPRPSGASCGISSTPLVCKIVQIGFVTAFQNYRMTETHAQAQAIKPGPVAPACLFQAWPEALSFSQKTQQSWCDKALDGPGVTRWCLSTK